MNSIISLSLVCKFNENGMKTERLAMNFYWLVCIFVSISLIAQVLGRSYTNEAKNNGSMNEISEFTSESTPEETSTVQKPQIQLMILAPCPKNRVSIGGQCRPKNKIV